MIRILSFCLFSVLILISSNIQAATLSPEAVTALIEDIDTAVSQRDLTTIANSLSDIVDITMNIKQPGGTQKQKVTKQEYLSSLRLSWSSATNYTYTKSNEKIWYIENKALFSANIKESMTLNNLNISFKSLVETTIELINGIPLISKVVYHIEM